MAKEVYGIDLGTTYSCIATFDENDSVTVGVNKAGQLTTPSVVYVKGDNDFIVGNAAKAQLAVDPDSSVAFIKREMSNDDFSRNIKGKTYDPVKISSIILKSLVDEANQKRRDEEGKDPINKVVITVPAYFGKRERDRTIEAGKQAGLEVLGLINEPTAAALTYGRTRRDSANANQTVLVYDLGGGTFDVSILKIEGGVVDTLSTDGDHTLGGVDWDTMLADYALAEAGMKKKLDELTGAERNQLLIDAEKAKQLLSEFDQTNLSFTYNGIHNVAVARKTFEDLTSELVDRTMELVDKAYEAAGNPKLDEVLLVGGSSKMPMIEKALKARFGLTPKLIQPDLAVAKGAALHAAAESGNKAGAGISMGRDKGSRSYGVAAYAKAMNDRFMVCNMIYKNDDLELHFEEDTYTTHKDGQSKVELRFFEGNCDRSEPYADLGACDELKGKGGEIDWGHPAPKGTPIHYIIDRDKSGTIKVYAECMGARGEFVLVTSGVGMSR